MNGTIRLPNQPGATSAQGSQSAPAPKALGAPSGRASSKAFATELNIQRCGRWTHLWEIPMGPFFLCKMRPLVEGRMPFSAKKAMMLHLHAELTSCNREG